MGKVKISKEEHKDLIFLDDIPWVGLPHNVRAAHLLHPAHMGGNGAPLCNTTSLNEQVMIIRGLSHNQLYSKTRKYPISPSFSLR